MASSNDGRAEVASAAGAISGASIVSVASIMDASGQHAPRPWLHVVGLGEDGLDGLGAGARRAISDAQAVFGGHRHLELAAAAITGEACPWPTPFDAGLAAVMARRGAPVCVLASGDPMHYGVGVTLARHVPIAEMKVWPAPSSFSLAAARLGWALQDVTLLSLHGRDEDALRAHLFPGMRLLVLTSDGAAPARLARMLDDSGFGASGAWVLEALGGSRERATATTAGAMGDALFDPLNVLALELRATERSGAADGVSAEQHASPKTSEAQPAPLGSGLDDSFFDHDGQITKREVRAVTLAALAPLPGQLLWDVGAGSGSIGIEWLRLSPAMRAIAIEQDAARAERARANAARLGVPRLDLRAGAAPEAFAGLPQPDAIFIGGGAREAVVDAARAALKPGGRLVINAVTLETQALLTTMRQRHGGDLISLAVARAAPVGGLTGWRVAMPIVQWRWSKP
ncbi:precorrin-6Y methyltransferase [Camelimonas fluminis]|nr:precorrin-6Y methyltransferase [Camelimonas fluminis]